MNSDNKLSEKREVDWVSAVFTLQTLMSCIFALVCVLNDAKLATTIFCIVLILLATIGITAGAHRFWAHKSYTATTSLRIFLMLCHSLGGTSSIYDWVRLHRLHHKFYQTNFDPYYSGKGFIHTQFITSNLKLSPAQEKLLEEVDMSDLEQDKVVMFQKKYFWIIFLILNIILPVNAPMEYWNETILNSVLIIGWLRLGLITKYSYFINTACTVFDYNKGDRNKFSGNSVFLVDKSYWISYHYLLPWDYQTSEFGKYGTGCITKLIRVFAALDLATDLKTVPSSLIREALTTAVNNKNNNVVEVLSALQNAPSCKLTPNFA